MPEFALEPFNLVESYCSFQILWGRWDSRYFVQRQFRGKAKENFTPNWPIIERDGKGLARKLADGFVDEDQHAAWCEYVNLIPLDVRVAVAPFDEFQSALLEVVQEDYSLLSTLENGARDRVFLIALFQHCKFNALNLLERMKIVSSIAELGARHAVLKCFSPPYIGRRLWGRLRQFKCIAIEPTIITALVEVAKSRSISPAFLHLKALGPKAIAAIAEIPKPLMRPNTIKILADEPSLIEDVRGFGAHIFLASTVQSKREAVTALSRVSSPSEMRRWLGTWTRVLTSRISLPPPMFRAIGPVRPLISIDDINRWAKLVSRDVSECYIDIISGRYTMVGWNNGSLLLIGLIKIRDQGWIIVNVTGAGDNVIADLSLQSEILRKLKAARAMPFRLESTFVDS